MTRSPFAPTSSSGGTDQKFNLLLGRDIQRAYGQPEQVVLTLPLLTGTDGERKMSKSLGNYIGVTESPEMIYGKTMSIPDASLAVWYPLLLGSAAPDGVPPRDAKRALARSLVTRFHGDAAGAAAEQAFDRVHVSHQPPEECRRSSTAATGGGVHLPALLARRSESRPPRRAAPWVKAASGSTPSRSRTGSLMYRPGRSTGRCSSSASGASRACG